MSTLFLIAPTLRIYSELDYVEALINTPEVQYLSLYAAERKLAPIEEVFAASSLSPTAAVNLASTTAGDAPVNPWTKAN